MRKILITFIVFCAVSIELVFIGFPYQYHHEHYALEKDYTFQEKGIEPNVRLNEAATKHILGAPTTTGAPYSVGFVLYGTKGWFIWGRTKSTA